MKTFYVYQKQFLLILAYTVTIHKCQGLSQINYSAIIDLSSKVFSPGMAYVEYVPLMVYILRTLIQHLSL